MTDNICVGAGLISLDVLIRDGERLPVSFYVGGTCGNVMMILSHMGWQAYPIARLDGTKDARRILDDMHRHHLHTDFITTDDGGKTPVIVQRNFVTKDGVPTHRFESRNNVGRFYLDFRSLTVRQADAVIERIHFVPRVFFFDRVSPAILRLATAFRQRGAVIFFEPSSRGNVKTYTQCVEVADIIKFSSQRFSDTSQFEALRGKLIIQTQGVDGLIWRLDGRWSHMPATANENIVDTSGAGDWTTAAFINALFRGRDILCLSDFSQTDIETALREAQYIAAKSCSFEGARGMMIESHDFSVSKTVS